jgi:hypothetical protein
MAGMKAGARLDIEQKGVAEKKREAGGASRGRGKRRLREAVYAAQKPSLLRRRTLPPLVMPDPAGRRTDSEEQGLARASVFASPGCGGRSGATPNADLDGRATP